MKSDVIQILLADAKQSLLSQICSRAKVSCADEAMLIWLLGQEVVRTEFKLLLQQVLERDERIERYQTLACAGFAAAFGELPKEVAILLPSAIRYQTSRDPFSGTTPMRFCSDGVALLGIVLASRAVDDSELTTSVYEWLDIFLPKILVSSSHSEWELGLLTAVAVVSGGRVDKSRISPTVSLALQDKGFLPNGTPELQTRLFVSVLESAKNQMFVNTQVIESALALTSLNMASSSASVDFSRPTVEDLVFTLMRVPSALKRWAWEEKPRTLRSFARKWHIDHEYHVQGLLYAILAPLFPDIREEENFPSVGQKNPRVDLYIPSLQLIVEVKFLREKTKIQDAIGEISEDCGLYRAHRREIMIVPFIWDAARRTEEYTLMRSGLMDLEGVHDAVIVPAPGWLDPEFKSL